MRRTTLFATTVAALSCLATACGTSDEEAYSQFVNLPQHEWLRTAPCYFKPGIEGDNLEILLSVRHENDYEYSQIGLTVDVINADTVSLRQAVTIPLVDNNGNWISDGFGSLYQCQVPVASNVRLDSASVILVWQSMDCDTLWHISDVGIDITRK